jgi:hypothetical protein
MNKYYFTFGTADYFPFKGGWVEVMANSEQEAIKIYNDSYPPSHEGTINCAFVYEQNEFEKTFMFTEGNLRGRCHKVLY